MQNRLFARRGFDPISARMTGARALLGFLATTGFLCSFGCTTAKGTPPSLVGHWKLDEEQGTVAADASGNANDGSLQKGVAPSPVLPPGRFRNARSLSFDGVDDFVSVSPSRSLANARTLTVAAWIKPGSAGQAGLGRIVNKRT